MAIEEREFIVYVQIRPGCFQFLQEMNKHYEVIIYTASLSKYADPLMNILDPEKLCTSRLFREHCTWLDQTYVKDMSLINRPMENIILIDNSPNSYRLQPENALPCTTWYTDPSDTELFEFIPLLTGLSKVKDVRVVLSQVHENHQLDMALASEMVRQLRLEIENNENEEERIDEDSLNQHITEETHRDEIHFGDPIKPPVDIIQTSQSTLVSQTIVAKQPISPGKRSSGKVSTSSKASKQTPSKKFQDKIHNSNIKGRSQM